MVKYYEKVNSVIHLEIEGVFFSPKITSFLVLYVQNKKDQSVVKKTGVVLTVNRLGLIRHIEGIKLIDL